MKRRIILALLCIAALFAVSSCSKSDDSKKTAEKVDKYKIGVILYGYTDIQGKQIKDYCDYLSTGFNVEFEFVSPASTDDAAHISILENTLASGVDAVISGYETSLKNSVELCEEYNVYYAVCLAEATQAIDEVSQNKYFIGGVKQFGENPAELGAKYAEAAYKAGVKHIGITSFVPMLFLDAPQIIEGFQTKFAELNGDRDYSIYEPLFHFFDLNQINTQVSSYMNENNDMDAIFALGSGMDFIYPIIKNSVKKDSIKLLSLGYNESSEASMNDGSLLMGGTNNYTEAIAVTFAQIYDKLNGNSFEQAKLNSSVNYAVFSNPQEVKDFKTYVIGDKSNGSVTIDELKKVMKTFNTDATYVDLSKLVNRSVSDVKEIRE